MKIPYTFCILRYRYDAVTQEFINVGVVVHAPTNQFLRAKCTSKYGRVSKMFGQIDGIKFRQLTEYIESKINEIGNCLDTGTSDVGSSSKKLLERVLPPDDSALQFSDLGAGVTDNLEKEVEALFERYISKYEETKDRNRRSDSEIWKSFSSPLEKRNIGKSISKDVSTSNLSCKFQHAWKNGVWHLCEPISFDLKEPESILNKAIQWLGQGTELKESTDKFKLYLLLGKPQDNNLQKHYDHALGILDKIPNLQEVYQESEAEKFADDLERALAETPHD